MASPRLSMGTRSGQSLSRSSQATTGSRPLAAEGGVKLVDPVLLMPDRWVVRSTSGRWVRARSAHDQLTRRKAPNHRTDGWGPSSCGDVGGEDRLDAGAEGAVPVVALPDRGVEGRHEIMLAVPLLALAGGGERVESIRSRFGVGGEPDPLPVNVVVAAQRLDQADQPARVAPRSCTFEGPHCRRRGMDGARVGGVHALDLRPLAGSRATAGRELRTGCDNP